MKSNRNNASVPWGEISAWRARYRKVFPRVSKLPCVPSVAAWLMSCIESYTRQGSSSARVLDVGAGEKDLYTRLSPLHEYITYDTQDVDDTHAHTYRSLDEVTAPYDFVVSCEVIEHLDAAEKCAFITDLYRVTAPGGWVAIGTPNAQHPTIFWRDFTHVMPIHYYDLAGLLGRAGYSEISVFRVVRMGIKKRILSIIFGGLLDLLHVDYAQSILVVAQKPL